MMPELYLPRDLSLTVRGMQARNYARLVEISFRFIFYFIFKLTNRPIIKHLKGPRQFLHNNYSPANII